MKYEIMAIFRKHLNENLNHNTADTYYFAVDKLLKNLQFNDVNEISSDFLQSHIASIKTKNKFGALKNGLKHFKVVFPDFKIPEEKFFKNLSVNKRNRTKKPKRTLYLYETRRKINSIKDSKKKYAYRLMLVSGLRVSEISELVKSDISISGDTITVNVRNGKGGSNGRVECLPDRYLATHLLKYMDSMTESEPLFHSASTLKKKAGELELECHDLRRIAAITYKMAHIDEMGTYKANEAVKNLLRHKRFSTTKRYLFNKKLKIRRSKKEECGG